MKPLCIYHGNCADGFTAAWVVWKFAGDEVEFHPGVYQNPPPDVTGRDVILVDFSYKRDVLKTMAQTARRILVLDHHKSAAEDLSGFVQVDGAGFNCHRWNRVHDGGVMAQFDMNRSGARIAWDFFFPDVKPPALLLHVEDRDLWRFKLPKTREIQAAVFSFPYDFATWERIMGLPTDVLAQEGEAIERKHHKDVAELVAATKRKMMIGGYVVPIANLPYTLTSDAGHLMCQPQEDSDGTSWVPPFAGCYWDTPEGRVFSLRSTDNGLDVSSVAAAYGGGGHRNASGFRIAHDKIAADGGPG